MPVEITLTGICITFDIADRTIFIEDSEIEEYLLDQDDKDMAVRHSANFVEEYLDEYFKDPAWLMRIGELEALTHVIEYDYDADEAQGDVIAQLDDMELDEEED